MLKPRKITKNSKKEDKQLLEKIENHAEDKWLICKVCDKTEVKVSFNIRSVICAFCVQKMTAPPDGIIKKAPDEIRPKGWHFKKYYVSPGKKVFSYGKEITNKKEIESLKKESSKKTHGKLKPKRTSKKRGRRNARNTK